MNIYARFFDDVSTTFVSCSSPATVVRRPIRSHKQKSKQSHFIHISIMSAQNANH